MRRAVLATLLTVLILPLMLIYFAFQCLIGAGKLVRDMWLASYKELAGPSGEAARR